MVLPVQSLVILLFAYVGGITTVLGAALAGVLYALLVYAESTFEGLGGLVFVAIGAAAVSLGRHPNGVAGIVLERLDVLRSLRRAPRPAAERRLPDRIPVAPSEAEVPA